MERLKRLDATDLISIPKDNNTYFAVTKEEVRSILKKYIKEEVDNIPEIISENHKNNLIKLVEQKISIIEKELDAFIEHKFNLLAEKTCELLLNRKFNEEVAKKAEERAEQLLSQKLKKGKF